jgi:hypothetical protein
MNKKGIYDNDYIYTGISSINNYSEFWKALDDLYETNPKNNPTNLSVGVPKVRHNMAPIIPIKNVLKLANGEKHIYYIYYIT